MRTLLFILALLIPGTAHATFYSYTVDPTTSYFYYDDYLKNGGGGGKIDAQVRIIGGTLTADDVLGSASLDVTFEGVTDADIAAWTFPGYQLPAFLTAGGSLDVAGNLLGGVFPNTDTGELGGIVDILRGPISFNDGSSSTILSEHQGFGSHGFVSVSPGRIGGWSEWSGLLPNGDLFEWGTYLEVTRDADSPDPTSVPEPATLALLAAGMLFKSGARRKARLSPKGTPNEHDCASV